MTYIAVKDFKHGIDRRRPKSEGIPGALWDAKNVHVTNGGDLESAMKFVPYYSVPNTFGCAVVKGQIFVFGSAPSVSVPAGVQYQRLQSPSSANMVLVLDAKPFKGKIYAIAQFDDGNIYHYYNGTRVTDWDAISDANSDIPTVADYLADLLNNDSAVEAAAVGTTIIMTARTAGVPFSIIGAAIDNGVINDQAITLLTDQASRVAVVEVLATATISVTGGTYAPITNRISSLKVGATELLGYVVPWQTSNNSSADALAGAVNNLSPSHGYSAVSASGVITITAPLGSGASLNTSILSPTMAGTFAVTTTAFAGGVAAQTALPQVVRAVLSGTIEANDKYVITLNGVQYYITPRGASAGASIYIHAGRVWSCATATLRYCKLNDAANWSDTAPTSGAGFIAIDNDSQGYERLIGIIGYGNLTAIFGRQNVSMYNLGADASQFSISLTLQNTGARASKGIISYGNSETLYLDDSGVRSLRPRLSTDAPYAVGIGAAIDALIKDQAKTVGAATLAGTVTGIEPSSGRLWIAIGARIYVLSYFPENHISAWTYYEPGFSITDIARSKSRMYVRAGSTIYLYGGANADTWPDDGFSRIIETPFLAAEKPATNKTQTGADVSAVNVWAMTIAPNPNFPDRFDTVGNVSGVTTIGPSISVPGYEPSWSVKFVCTKAGKASLSSFEVHYNEQGDH